MSSLPPEVCLIGVSGYAGVHYADLVNLHQEGRIRLTAATIINEAHEIDKSRRLRELDCRVFADYRDMLEFAKRSCSLCVIPTGIAFHAPMSIHALEAGCNVLVEKPAAATMTEIRQMQEAERRSGCSVAVGFQALYAAETLSVKRMILDGEIGRLKAIRCRGLWPREDSYYARNAWSGRLRVDGAWVLDSPLNNAFSHELAMACFLAGSEERWAAEITEVQAELYRARTMESADTGGLRAVTSEDVSLLFLFSHSSERVLDPEMQILGEGGTILWNPEGIRVSTRESTRVLPSSSGETRRRAMMDAVLRRLKAPEHFICDLDIASAQTRCVNAAHASSDIHLIPSDCVRMIPSKNSRIPTVVGIEQVVEEGFKEGLLFSEMGVPWGRPGRRVAVGGGKSRLDDGAGSHNLST